MDPTPERECDRCGRKVTDYIEGFFGEVSCLDCIDAVAFGEDEEERDE